ncbi:MAG TPA: hypothetical protein VK629_13580, partial [Steroidobacteraceae bacterium]|nr:hypothetical protein [Steroidobacteraceae bacterium]
PILSPHRLSANSQYRMALAADAFQILKPDALSDGESSLRYLRFRSGSYGLANLKLLAELQDHPDADRLRKESLAIQNLKHRGEPIPINVEDMFALLVISPPNREIDAKLRAKIIENASRPRANRQTSLQTPESAGLFVDLQGDTTEEFVLLRPNGGEVYEFAGGEWTLVARAILPARATFDDSENSGSMLENVKAGKVSVESARWKHLTIGPLRYDVQ